LIGTDQECFPGKDEKLHYISSQFDVMASAILAHGDAFNEPWQDRGQFCAGFRIVQRDVEVGHGGSVDI
jgi:hypothetical protein